MADNKRNMAVIHFPGCTWTHEVKQVLEKKMGCQRFNFKSANMAHTLSELDVVLLPLVTVQAKDESQSPTGLTALPLEIFHFLSEAGALSSLRIVALTCGAHGPDCAGAQDDGFGMPAAACLRGMFRCFRIDHPSVPILHIDTDALGIPGKAEELQRQVEAELSLTADLGSRSLVYTGREVAYRRSRRFLPKLDICGQRPPGSNTSVSSEGVALITGGTGGLGITTAEAMVDAGVRCVVLSSRSGAISATAPGNLVERVAKLQQSASIILEACDAADEKQVVSMLDRLRQQHGNLRWVVNAAGIVLPNEPEKLEAVFVPKCLGAWNMHKHTQHDDLEAMWFFSSLSGGIGSEGMHNYAAANCYLDELARLRRSQGLPGVSLQFPEVEEAGMAAAFGTRSSGATVSLAVVRRAVKQLMLGEGDPAAIVALLPVGYLIPRSVFHMTALEPLKARVDQDLWANLERLEGEKKDEVKSMRKEIAERRQAARLVEKGAESSMQSCSSLVLPQLHMGSLVMSQNSPVKTPGLVRSPYTHTHTHSLSLSLSLAPSLPPSLSGDRSLSQETSSKLRLLE